MANRVVHVFNQYYFDLLKKVKSNSSQLKYDSKKARSVIKAVKRHYLHWDKLSDSYLSAFQEHNAAWDEYRALGSSLEELNQWVSQHGDLYMYQEITLEMVHEMLAKKDIWLMHYFLTVIACLSIKDLSDACVSDVLFVLRNMHKTPEVEARVQAIDQEQVKHLLQRLVSHYKERMDTENPLKGMEDTTIGKLAKEIIQEVDVGELQQSLSEGGGDIFSALTNPNSGVTKLLGTVSQKMLSKMASGELKHDTLLQDAMKFASTMGGSDGPLGPMGGMMTDMMKNFMGGGGGGAGGSGDGMEMLSGLMRQMGMGMGGGMGGGSRGAAPSASKPSPAMNPMMRRNIQARQLRKKLEKRKENVKGDVEEPSSSNEPATTSE